MLIEKNHLLLSNKHINHLPVCVQEYLVHAGTLGKERIETVVLRQKGVFNIKGDRWIDITAHQSIDVTNHNFVWKARAGIFHVTDQYINGKGKLTIKLLGWIPFGWSTGPEIDQGEASRFLSEIVWYPSACCDPIINWTEVSDYEAKATMAYDNLDQTSLIFTFNEQHNVECISGKRYRKEDREYILEDWIVSDLIFQKVHGINVPIRATVSWEIDGVYKPYYRLEITEIQFN